MVDFFMNVEGLPVTATYNDLVELIWKEEYWIQKIFNKKRTILPRDRLRASVCT